ncbi:MAG: sterol desaturase family protein [Desulfatibacillaceae bacterium]
MTLEQAQAIRLAAFIAGLAFFLAAELVNPYRTPSVSKKRRWVRNLLLTGVNNVVLALALRGLVFAVAIHATANELGLLHAWELPAWFRIAATIILMDLFLWVWHLLNHLVPLLWRFHRVHHADMNMDVSTATRFHIGELAASVPLKMGVAYAIGANPWGIILFEGLVVLTTQFHHSSLKAPEWFEKFWWILFVPPSMHRIHHSVVIKERDSNYGVIFSVWDRTMGTLVRNVNQDRIRIGMGAYRDHDRLGVRDLLKMPFTPPVR